MEDIKKFKDLTLNNSYTVEEYSAEFKNKYGVSHILAITDNQTGEKIKIWSNKMLTNYISDEKPLQKFIFTVKQYKEHKVADIKGYDRFKVTKLY
jgi:hypothetical protein